MEGSSGFKKSVDSKDSGTIELVNKERITPADERAQILFAF